MAEAWLIIGLLHLNLGDSAGEEYFERAIDCARRSGNRRAELDASKWLVVIYALLPVPTQCHDRPRGAIACSTLR